MKNLPSITGKQKEILLLLYKFRFLNTHHFQKLLNHKNSNGILVWLKDLKEKEYINSIYSRTTFGENTKPAIHYLAPRARHTLKNDNICDLNELNRVYKEKQKTQKFIDHCLLLADIYLFLQINKEKDEVLRFFTKGELGTYHYFPDPLPDAYVSVKSEGKTKRYFLDIFDEFTPSFVFRARVKRYLEYVREGKWEETTEGIKFPSILLVCPNESRKKHVNYYAKNLLEKTLNNVNFFLTTKETVKFSKNSNIWQKVE